MVMTYATIHEEMLAGVRYGRHASEHAPIADPGYLTVLRWMRRIRMNEYGSNTAVGFLMIFKFQNSNLGGDVATPVLSCT